VCHAVIDDARRRQRLFGPQPVEKYLRSGRDIGDVQAFAIERLDLGVGVIEFGRQIEADLAARETIAAALAVYPRVIKNRSICFTAGSSRRFAVYPVRRRMCGCGGGREKPLCAL
jgi:hypothetical protein